ncbi:unnamed protein product [Moneuplotes crassus]|uniref:Uncharacterized protein n=1 Tax=Euplotes crassus TaxID=5936 RepID=A0AAD1XTH3_EUPCR|nr:unnamed protein product [Moneuplotes crassus]
MDCVKEKETEVFQQEYELSKESMRPRKIFRTNTAIMPEVNKRYCFNDDFSCMDREINMLSYVNKAVLDLSFSNPLRYFIYFWKRINPKAKIWHLQIIYYKDSQNLQNKYSIASKCKPLINKLILQTTTCITLERCTLNSKNTTRLFIAASAIPEMVFDSCKLDFTSFTLTNVNPDIPFKQKALSFINGKAHQFESFLVTICQTKLKKSLKTLSLIMDGFNITKAKEILEKHGLPCKLNQPWLIFQTEETKFVKKPDNSKTKCIIQ